MLQRQGRVEGRGGWLEVALVLAAAMEFRQSANLLSDLQVYNLEREREEIGYLGYELRYRLCI